MKRTHKLFEQKSWKLYPAYLELLPAVFFTTLIYLSFRMEFIYPKMGR